MSQHEDTRPLFTPFNIFATIVVLVGLVLTAMRFTGGLGAVTNLDNNNPWGIWIGFDLLTGVALAAGGFVTSAAVYIFGLKKYHSAVRPAILTAFLGYAMVVVALHFDVGRPWRLPYPFLVSRGTTSILFEVAACVAMYLTVLFMEFSPAALEWLGKRKLRRVVLSLTLLLTIFGVVLSTLHQSSLGALFMIAPSKLHPLWYSGYLPIYFFVSAIIAGLSMVIFEAAMSHKAFKHKFDEEHLAHKELVALGFGKAAAVVLFGYFCIKVLGIAVDNKWSYLATGYGAWFLVELLGFVLLPALMFGTGAREKKMGLVQFAAGWTVFGVILNRFNVCLVAFNYHLPASERYFPSWMEIWISLFLVTAGILVFRFVVTRMPIFHRHPDFADHKH